MDEHTLFDLVRQYHDLGVHQSGTVVDAATADWLAEHLERREMTVEQQSVPFHRFVHTSELLIDGQPIDHLPLFYEWTGKIETADVDVQMIDAAGGGSVGLIDDFVAMAAASGREASVLATDHPNGSLVAVNRAIQPGTNHPVLLVAGRDHARLVNASEIVIRMRAWLETAATTNVVARNAAAVLDGPQPPLLLTTPLTAWVPAAGERGTGIAVFLELVERLVDVPVVAVACGGHELDHLGVQHWLDTASLRPGAVVHLGASVAVDEPSPDGRILAPTRLGATNLAGRAGDAMREALARGGLIIRTNTDEWVGESKTLQVLDVPMVSIAGRGIDFHTPDDTPERATSPGALGTMADVVEAAARILVSEITRPGAEDRR